MKINFQNGVFYAQLENIFTHYMLKIKGNLSPFMHFTLTV